MQYVYPTFVAREDDQVALRYLNLLERNGYRTSIVTEGERSLPGEVVLLGTNCPVGPGWCNGSFRIAAHTISKSCIPDWVTTPFVVAVRIPSSGHVRPRYARSIAKSYNTFFESGGEILPCGTPIRVTGTRITQWIQEVQAALREYPVTDKPQAVRLPRP